MESLGRESSAVASSLRKIILMPRLSEWHYGSCRRCLPWAMWPVRREINPKEIPWLLLEARPKLPKPRLRYGLPLRRLSIRL